MLFKREASYCFFYWQEKSDFFSTTTFIFSTFIYVIPFYLWKNAVGLRPFHFYILMTTAISKPFTPSAVWLFAAEDRAALRILAHVSIPEACTELIKKLPIAGGGQQKPPVRRDTCGPKPDSRTAIIII